MHYLKKTFLKNPHSLTFPDKIYSIQQISTEYVPGIILEVMNMAKSRVPSLIGLILGKK